MQNGFFGGLDFANSGVRISIINSNKELKYFNSVQYEFDFKNPNSWINSCEKLLHSLPLNIKSNIVNLAISGNSGSLTAFDLKGDPLEKVIPDNNTSSGNKTLIESKTFGVDPPQNTWSNLSQVFTLIDKYGENILLRHQSDWITGWFLKDWTYGEEENYLKIGWDLIKESWPKSYLRNSWQKCLPIILKSGEIIGQINSELAERFKFL